LASGLGWLLSLTPPGTALDLKLQDTYFVLREGLAWNRPRVDERLVIVAIDPRTAPTRWFGDPVQRRHKPFNDWGPEFARAFRALGGEGRRARAVLFDLILVYPAELPPPGETPEAERKALESPWSEKDLVIAQAAAANPVILTAKVEEGPAGRLLTSIEPLLALAAQRADPASPDLPVEYAGLLGLANMARDPDGLVRRAHLVLPARLKGQGLTLLASWLQTVRYAWPFSLVSFEQAWRRAEASYRPWSRAELELASGAQRRRIPLVSEGGSERPADTMLINYAGPAGTIERISLAEVLDHADDPPWLDRKFRGRVVLVGVTLADYQDYHFTPMAWVQRDHPATRAVETREGMPGVEILANAANTFLTGQFLAPPPPLVVPLVSLALALLGALVACRLPLRPLLLVVPFLVLGYYFAGLALFCQAGTVMPQLWPQAALLWALAGGFTWRQWTTEARRRQVRQLLGRYVSDPVARLLEENPEAAALGGRVSEITVLFSDLNDFTTWSEKTGPEVVVQVLNEYFTEMERIIFEEGGTLKQFVGDEIMVIFGAPFPQPDMEWRAVRTALAMQAGLERLGEGWAPRGIPRLQAKIGIHRGRVVLGNVGSPRRTEYTAIGDVVNTASRIMNLTKKVGHMVLISDSVYEKVKDQVVVREFPPQEVKGRQARVTVYGLEGLRPAAPGDLETAVSA
jgi:class 3 adenylate cyclase/CHASE2 domain-containing sensor protein